MAYTIFETSNGKFEAIATGLAPMEAVLQAMVLEGRGLGQFEYFLDGSTVGDREARYNRPVCNVWD